jgi:hypothetical protein
MARTLFNHRGRVHIDQFIAEQGVRLAVPQLRRILAAENPRMPPRQVPDVCWEHFQGLARAVLLVAPVVSQPDEVDVNEVLFRATAQEP